MKPIKKTTLRLISRRADGPFSYKAWPRGIKYTVISSKWVDGELVLIEVPALQFIINQGRFSALSAYHKVIGRLDNIAINLSEPELISLQHSLIAVLDGINLRYGAPPLKETIDDNATVGK